jgi:tetratricopeptide (TPR) repeat protein
LKILAGPDNWEYLTKYFGLGLENFDCKVFGYDGSSQLTLQWGDSLRDLLTKLPKDWEPDWVIWWLPEYLRFPADIHKCPYPTLLIVSDWNVISEPLYRMVEAFDVVATDAMGVGRLSEFGVDVPIFQAPLFGFEPGYHRLLECERDIPVGYIGNTNGLAYRDRMRTLATACHGLEQGQVMVASGVFGEEYVQLLNRCRITLNHSLRGELNMRSFEAMACGSLLFCEDTNLEAGQFFQDGEHLVMFNQSNLVDKLRYYLRNPEEAARIARTGYKKVQEFSYQKQWTRLLKQAQSLLIGKPRPFLALPAEEQKRRYLDYSYQVFSPLGLESALEQAKRIATELNGDDRTLNLLACMQSFQADLSSFGKREKLFREALSNFEKVSKLGLLPRLSRARVLVNLGRAEEAVELLKDSLNADLEVEQVGFYPRLMHPLALAWERDTSPESREAAARWLAHDLLSALDEPGRASHARKALSHRSDQPTTWLRLSRCDDLPREQQLEALSQAIELAPFLVEAHLLRLETASPSAPRYAGWTNDTKRMVESLTGDDFGETKKRYRTRLRHALDSRSKGRPPTNLEDFANGIRFDLCPPETGLNNLFLWEPTKSVESINTVFPVDDQAIKERLRPIADVPRMSTLALAAVINRAVAQMPEGQAYLNVGVWNGYSFLAGLLGNSEKRCIGVDDFSQFGGPEDDFRRRFEQFRSPAHTFHDLDYEVYLRTRHKEPLGVYFYDGEHSYKNQYTGLRAAEKFFAPGCWILVDDTNWDEPREATLEFIRRSRRRYRLVLDARTPYSGHPTWWNGFMLLQHLGPIRKRKG